MSDFPAQGIREIFWTNREAKSISGLPQTTIPIGTVDRAPVGISVIGWHHGDEALLLLAERLARHVGIAA